MTAVQLLARDQGNRSPRTARQVPVILESAVGEHDQGDLEPDQAADLPENKLDSRSPRRWNDVAKRFDITL